MRPVSNRRVPALTALIAIPTLVVTLVPRSDVVACGGTPPPPYCGQTLVLAKSAPNLVLLPSSTASVNATVYFNLTEFPAGSGTCPTGPFTIDIDLSASCVNGDMGSGSITSATITPGWNSYTIPVSITSSLSQTSCTISGTATVSLGGSTLQDSGDTQVCLVNPDPDPVSTPVPRLDLEILEPHSQRDHPGDQARYTYRITNNDDTHAFNGTFTHDMENSSRYPAVPTPLPTPIPGYGPYAVSDTGLGDNFPLAFDPGGPDYCLPLPPDPLVQTIPQITTAVTLGPNETVDIPVIVRHWGMCADGSCSEGRVLLDGQFADLSQGLACAGVVAAADISQAPDYLWPDSGQVMTFGAPPLGQSQPWMRMQGNPTLSLPIGLDIGVTGLQIEINDTPQTPQVVSGQVGTASAPGTETELGRVTHVAEGSFAVDSFFDIAYQIQLPPEQGATVDTEIVALNLMSNAPVGFEDRFPFGMAVVSFTPPSADEPNAFVEFFHQMHVMLIDDQQRERNLLFTNVELIPDAVLPNVYQVVLQGQPEPLPGGGTIQQVIIGNDFRGFSTELPQGTSIFTDGFESGDVAAWSNSVP